MKLPEKASSRKNFLRWGLTMLGSATIFRAFSRPKEQKPEMVKMLTADGRLVEVDKNIIATQKKGRKASNKDIFDWMKNPSK